MSTKGDINLKMILDIDFPKIEEKIQSITNKIQSFLKEKAVKVIKVTLEGYDVVQKQVKNIIADTKERKAKVKVEADTKEATQKMEEIEKKQDAITAQEAIATLQVDTKEANEKIVEVQAKAEDATQKRQMELEAMTVGALEDLRQLEHVARDTGEKIESDLFVEVRADYGKAQEALEKYKKEFKAGYAEMNETQREAGRSMIKHLKNIEVEAGRHLNNVTNTGEKTLSRLQVKFDQITEKMGLSWKRFGSMAITALGSVFSKKSFDILAENVAMSTRVAKMVENVGKSAGLSTLEIEGNIKALEEQAKQLASVGVAGENHIKTIQAQLATFDMATSEILELTPAIVDYVMAEKGASATTADFQSMTNGLAQALNGQYSSLSRAGFTLEEYTKELIANGTEAEKAEEIARVLMSTYQGFNETLAQTPEGQMIMLQQEMENLQASIAELVLPVVLFFTETLKNIVVGITDFVQNNKILVLSLGTFATVAGIGAMSAGALKVALSALGKGTPGIVAGIKSMSLAMKGLVVSMGPIAWAITAIAGLAAVTVGTIGKIKEYNKTIQDVEKKTKSLADRKAELTKKINETGEATEEEIEEMARLNMELDAQSKKIDEAKEQLGAWSNFWMNYWYVVKGVFRMLKVGFSEVGKFITDIFQSYVIKPLGTIKTKFTEWVNSFEPLAKAFGFIGEVAGDVFDFISNKITWVIDQAKAVVEWFGGLFSFFAKEGGKGGGIEQLQDDIDKQKKEGVSDEDLQSQIDAKMKQFIKQGEVAGEQEIKNLELKTGDFSAGDIEEIDMTIETGKTRGGGGGGSSKKKTPEQIEEEKRKEAEKALKAELERKKKREEAILRQKKEALEKERKQQLEHINQTEKNELNRLAKRQEINKLFDKKLENLTKDSAQIQRELEEERLQEMQKISGELANMTTQEAQRRENLTKTYEQESEKIVEAVEKMQKDILKTIEEVNHALDTLEEDTTNKYLKRNVDAKKEIEKAQKELQELANKHKGIEYSVDFLPNWSHMSRDEKMGDTKISEIEKYKELLDLVKKLKAEQEYIAGLTTEEQRNAQDTYEELSKAEQITQEYEKQKAVLEEKKKVHEAILAGEEINLDEIQDYKNRQLAEELIAKRDGFEREKAMLKAKYDADLANYEDLQKALRKLDDETAENALRNNVEVLKSILEINRARGKGPTTSAYLSTPPVQNKVINVQNTNHITLNNEVNNNLDVNALNNQIIKSIQNENNGIPNITL